VGGHTPLAMKGTKGVVVGTSRSQRADIRSSHPSAIMPRMDGAPRLVVVMGGATAPINIRESLQGPSPADWG
jgi:hypothetical protein